MSVTARMRRLECDSMRVTSVGFLGIKTDADFRLKSWQARLCNDNEYLVQLKHMALNFFIFLLFNGFSINHAIHIALVDDLQTSIKCLVFHQV